jgi:hypothetical protein
MPVPDEPEPSTFGFNSEVSYRGATYHVQTESMVGGTAPSVNTLVYLKGALVRKIATPCGDSMERGDASLEEQVKRQHLGVLARIKRGEFLSD